MTTPDISTKRRISYLERRIEEIEFELRRTAQLPRQTLQLNSRLWLCTLNEDMGYTTAGEAEADLLKLDETDTLLDVTVHDPTGAFEAEATADGNVLVCLEQLDLSGERYFVLVGGGGLHWIEFALTEDLATSDASADADVVSGYGAGLPAAETAVTVLNLETHTNDAYMFAGSTGWKGLAMHKGGTNYQIFQLECPPV